MAASVNLLIVLLVLINSYLIAGDTAANCTFEDAVGAWQVDVYKYTEDRSIMGDIIYSTQFKFYYPNLATNSYGRMGLWTMIYNQGFEVTIDNRKWLFMFWNGFNSTYDCTKTLVHWTHDETVRQWYNFQAQKIGKTSDHKQISEMSHNPDRLYRRNDRMIAQINRVQNSWKATHYPEFEKLTLSQLKKLAGTRVHSVPEAAPISPELEKMVKSLPKSFDWRHPADGAGSFVTPVRHQDNCGSCYAFASAAALEARIQVFTNRTLQPILSPQDIVDCSRYSEGCNGGFAYLIAGKYGHDFGFVEEQCNPYKGRDTGSCGTATNCRRYYTTNYRYIGGYYGACNEALMKLELVHRGPFPVGIMVYDDFMTYKSGVYRHTQVYDHLNRYNPFQLTNHAVLLVGYGYDEDLRLPYWIIKNSWGTHWGEDGYVRILRGADEIAVESLGVSFEPMF